MHIIIALIDQAFATMFELGACISLQHIANDYVFTRVLQLIHRWLVEVCATAVAYRRFHGERYDFREGYC